MKCVYCDKKIIKESNEHVIQNALGGQLKSIKICCGKCNNKVRELIDSPFCEIFNPIIGNIHNFAKTDNKKSKPSWAGKALFKHHKIYDVNIKAGKIVDCKELKKELKRNLTEDDFNDFVIISHDFNIENIRFKNGLRKIAINFALENDVDADLIKEFMQIDKEEDEIKNILLRNAIIPFVPLNPFDEYIELTSPFELYHSLILFNQANCLWCYIDLFNTFQYYVLLSERWNSGTISKTYFQYMQRIDRSVPEIYVRKPKDILYYADHYNIKPTMDLDMLEKRIKEVIEKESLRKNMANTISNKLGTDYLTSIQRKNMQHEEVSFYLKSLQLYMNEDDYLMNNRFRQVTCLSENNMNIYSYPMLINEMVKSGDLDVAKYTFSKFGRLNEYLIGC